MNQQYFPSPEDHDKLIEDRLHNLCGQLTKKTFVSSQNVALIQHLIGMPGDGFMVRVRFMENLQRKLFFFVDYRPFKIIFPNCDVIIVMEIILFQELSFRSKSLDEYIFANDQDMIL